MQFVPIFYLLSTFRAYQGHVSAQLVYNTSLPLPAFQRLDRCLHALSSNDIGQCLVLEDYAHWGWGEGLLVGKRVEEVWEKKRKKGKIIIIINKKLTGKINMKKKEEKTIKKQKTYYNVRVSNVSACMGV